MEEDKINQMLINSLRVYKKLMVEGKKEMAINVLRIASLIADRGLIIGRLTGDIKQNYKPTCSQGHKLSDDEIRMGYVCLVCDDYEGDSKYANISPEDDIFDQYETR